MIRLFVIIGLVESESVTFTIGVFPCVCVCSYLKHPQKI